MIEDFLIIEARARAKARSRFPSAITRSQTSGSASEPIRPTQPSAAQVATMTASELRAHYQRTGQWVSRADMPALERSKYLDFAAQREHYGRRD